MVIIQHMSDFLPIPWAGDFYRWGYAGVDLFFVISGFVITYTTRLKTLSPTEFFSRRLLRVAPLYWAVTLLTIVAAWIVPSIISAGGVSLPLALSSLAFIPFEKAPGNFMPLVPVGWTLNYEIFFYACFGLSLLCRKRAASLLLLAAGFMALVCYGTLGTPKGTLAIFYSDSIILEFLFGMLIGWGYAKITNFSKWVGWSAVVLGGLGIAAGAVFFNELLRVIAYGIPAAFVVAGAVVLEGAGWRISNRIVILLGAASYSLYLTHFQIVQVLARVVPETNHSVGSGVSLFLIGITVVTLGGILSYILIERPLTATARKTLLPRKKSQRLADT